MQLKSGERVLVMGLAKSGEAVARLLLSHGLEVVVNDGRPRKDPDFEAEQLEALGAKMVFGAHPLSLLDERPQFIVKNPGIPYHVPLLVRAREQGIPIYTEIEVAFWLCEAPVYAITGSNGKTTTTTLVGEMFSEAGKEAVVAGNIGRVFSGVIGQIGKDESVVLEVSSFQLMGIEEFHPRIAALLNLYEAHLDYHGSFTEYVAAKMRMFENMTEADLAILNYDSDIIREKAASIHAGKVWFSRKQAVRDGVYVENGHIYATRDGASTHLLEVSQMALRGEHNVENAIAAAAIAMWAGVDAESVKNVLTRFRGVEHRTEFVRELSGVSYYNDSKATNPQAALRALRSFPGEIVWIAGGLDRGDDFTVLEPDIRQRVKAAVLLGQSADKLERVCVDAGVEGVVRVSTLEEAVSRAHQLVSPGSVVLLSPACASWDMFTSFEERGRIFKEIVHTL